jgi:hypothetical protein
VKTVRNEAELAHAYLFAKKDVLGSIYRKELIFLRQTPEDVSESDFLRELAWAVLSGGMAEAVIRAKFPAISQSFLEWESAQRISENAEECVAQALCHFRHEGKVRAIATAATMLCAAVSFNAFKIGILSDPIDALQCFPYIGPITAFHVAKNIGVKVAKPDRHLARLARSNGFGSVDEFCRTIADFLGEDIRLIDSVLWRFATMHRDYTIRFSRLGRAGVVPQ